MTEIANLKYYTCEGVEAVEFKLVRDDEDPDDVQPFHPDMCHQIFGENEAIFGYKDLRVYLYYSAGPLDIYLDYEYSALIDDLHTVGLKADDITTPIVKLFPSGGYFTNKKEFLSSAKANEKIFKPFGQKIYDYSFEQDKVERNFEIYIAKNDTPGFTSFHKRLETFIFWFIDAASAILLDPQWVYFVVYEKYKNKNNEDRYATVGYCTVYLYYSYPENVRPRVSQVMILPPYQKCGIGTELLKAIYEHFQSMTNVADITFEEPSEILQKTRTRLDVSLCKTLKSFAPEKLKLGFSKDMLKEAQAVFKINPKQCRLVYEISRLDITDKNNEEEYKNYRIEVKKRLNIVYSKQRRAFKRVQDRGFNITPSDSILPSVQDRIEQLIHEYEIVEEMYEQILKKAAN